MLLIVTESSEVAELDCLVIAEQCWAQVRAMHAEAG